MFVNVEVSFKGPGYKVSAGNLLADRTVAPPSDWILNYAMYVLPCGELG